MSDNMTIGYSSQVKLTKSEIRLKVGSIVLSIMKIDQISLDI